MSVHKKLLEKHQHQQHPLDQPILPPVEVIEPEQNNLLEQVRHLNSPDIRPTSLVFPSSKSTYCDAKMPFALVIQPYGLPNSEGFPQVNYGNYPILRCNNCRAYVNPFMKFMDENQYMKCNLCNLITKITYSYSTTVNRSDLTHPSYDIKAGQEYQARPPMPPSYFFMIDVSTRSQGILPMIGQIIKTLIQENKFNERTLFGFLTFDTVIHLYNFNPKLKSVQMFILSDQNDLDLPTPGDYLFNLSDSQDIIVGFLDNLDKLFPKPQQNSTQFVRALKMSHKIMGEIGGKLLMVCCSNVQELNTKTEEKNKNYMLPSTPQLQQITQEMHFQYICPSLFVIPHQFMNLITLNQLIKYLNGDLFYYDDPNTYVQNFYYDFKSVMGKDYAWESVFRIRPSLGWRVKQIYGNYSIKSNDLLSLTCNDDSKSLVYELELINPQAQFDALYIQTALLYTSSNGERRIRVQNYCLPLVSQIKYIYDHMDTATVSAVIAKISLYQFYKPLKISEIQQFILNSLRFLIQNAKFFTGNKHISLFAYFLGILRSQVFTNTYDNSPNTDYANYLRSIFTYMNVDELISFFVPKLYRLSDIQNEDCTYNEDGYFQYPQQLALQYEEVAKSGIYLIDVGNKLIILIAQYHDQQMCEDIFGKSYREINLTEDNMYSNSNNPLNDKIYYLIYELRKYFIQQTSAKSTKYCPLHIVRDWCEIKQYLMYDANHGQLGYEQLVQNIG